MGAVDVIPIVPLGDTPMERAVKASHTVARRLAERFDLPVFLYEQSARMPSRRRLADVRRGGFEALPQRLLTEAPDYGPRVPHATAGAVAVGARWALIAFNCYLNTKDRSVARRIARAVRESGGGLKAVRALGLTLERQQAVQVSMNIVDYPTSSMVQVMEEVSREALLHGVEVVRSELIGLMPLQALLDVTQHYLKLDDLTPDDVIELNINHRAIEAVRVPSPTEGSTELS
jgi:glutamate formiminotransferase